MEKKNKYLTLVLIALVVLIVGIYAIIQIERTPAERVASKEKWKSTTALKVTEGDENLYASEKYEINNVYPVDEDSAAITATTYGTKVASINHFQEQRETMKVALGDSLHIIDETGTYYVYADDNFYYLSGVADKEVLWTAIEIKTTNIDTYKDAFAAMGCEIP